MYRTEPLFPYINGYLLAILPKTMKNIDKTNCSFVECENNIVYFKIDTPEEIKTRFVKEYAEFLKSEKKLGRY